MSTDHVSHLSNAELTAELSRLAHRERAATVALIVHLAEFDARRLYEGAGFSSLFKYCMAVLRLSEDAVYNRIEVARLARRYPVVIDMLVEGSLSPTTARLLARHLTSENHEELLASAVGKGKQQVEELLARHFPRPDVPPSVRRIPTQQVSLEGSIRPASAPCVNPSADAIASEPATTNAQTVQPDMPAPSVASTSRRPLVRPLAPERYEVRFTADAEIREDLRVAQDLLGHAIPSGDLAQVFGRALKLLVADLTRKKYAATQRPRRSRGQSKGSRNIPAEVRRAVSARDGGRCAFIATTGRRCGERRFLEFHHIDPYGRGGLPTVDNVKLLCRAHNGYETDVFYGPGKRRPQNDVVSEARVIYGRVTDGPQAAWITRSGTGTPIATQPRAPAGGAEGQ
jgi:hypothetical protein